MKFRASSPRTVPKKSDTCIRRAFFVVRLLPRTLLVLFALFSLFPLAGCENTAPPKSVTLEKPQYTWGKITGQRIVIRGNTPDLKRPYLQKAFKRYQELTGNTIVIEGLTRHQLVSNLPAAFLAGTKEKPDILLSNGGTTIESLDPDNNFYDFTNAPWVKDLTDTAINQTIQNARVIGLPYWEASIAGILYNKEIFREYGIKVPRNHADFWEACNTLLQHGVIPMYLPFAEPTMMLYQFPLDSVAQKGKNLEMLNQGELTYQQIPEMEKIVEWYKTMSDKGYFGKEYTQNDWAGMDPALRSGRYAMMLCWDTWLYTDFTGDPSKFGIMPAFMGVPDQGTFEGPNLMLLIVNKQSPRLEAALDLISFMADPYNYNETFQGIYTAPVFKNQQGSLSTPQYVATERLIEKLFHDSTAWLRIRGFSQMDALYIQKYMRDTTYSVQDCLRDMDNARIGRTATSLSKKNVPNETQDTALQPKGTPLVHP